MLIAILGYRLGLRRDEIAGLQLNSVQGLVSPETGETVSRPLLWVHVTEWSGIKRTSSARRLPLALLLCGEELALLRRWFARRFRECAGHLEATAPLFTATAGKMEKVGDAPFKAITQAMHAVTGDRSLRFHHLRHSFITLLNARMLAVVDPAGRADVPASWKSEAENLQGPALLRSFLRLGQAPRHAIYQTAALVGHLDPQETQQSYNHGFDWLLERHRSRAETPITLGLLANLRGISYSAAGVDRLRKRSRDESAAAAPKRQFALKDLVSVQLELFAQVRERGWTVQPPDSEEYVQAKLDLPSEKQRSLLDLSLDDVYGLALSAKKRMPDAACAALFELTSDEVALFRAAAARRAGTKSLARDEQRRSPKYLASRGGNKRTPNSRKRPEIEGMGPALPTAPAELRDARSVFDRLRSAFVENPLETLEAQTAFIACVNRNNAELTSNNEYTIEALALLTQIAGIERHRIRLEVLSLPNTEGARDATAMGLAALFKVSAEAVHCHDDAGTARGRSKYGKYGRVSVWVLEPSNQSRAHLAKHAAKAGYGWKVACYYAICVVDAIRHHVGATSWEG